jgi:hypothetical protein
MKTAMFVFVTGLLVTFGGVGGVEHSITDSEFFSALIVSAVGLMIMWAGTKLINRANRG